MSARAIGGSFTFHGTLGYLKPLGSWAVHPPDSTLSRRPLGPNANQALLRVNEHAAARDGGSRMRRLLQIVPAQNLEFGAAIHNHRLTGGRDRKKPRSGTSLEKNFANVGKDRRMFLNCDFLS